VRPDDPGLPVIGSGTLSGVRKSKRGPWRAAVLIGVHAIIALHITHYVMTKRTLSPVEPSESMYTLELGYVNAGFVFFGIALLATLVFGRFFCGWGCHIVALQDFCAWIMKRLGVRPRPFRARFLALTPAVVAFYMFVWPTLARVFASPPRPFPGLTNHFVTNDLWATFPGPVFTALTYAVCGFAAVYFLGAKGFCTYGCPYGSLFGALDYASPGRIVVSDACEQCGHCTATCTSNVRVHEEVRLYGMVVDPGCMKCTDCISVCPKGALSYSFAKPAFLTKNAARPARRYDLSLGDEILVAAAAALAILVFRDLYNGPPLLLSVGLGGITGFVTLKLWQLLRRPSVRIQNLELKSSGAVTRAGGAFAVVTVLWLAFTAHSAFAQWHRAWGRYELDHTEVTREDGLSGAYRGKTYSADHARALDEAFRHFSLADRFGIAGVVEVKLGLAWCHLLRGENDAATSAAGDAVALAPDRPELRRNLADIEAADAASRFAAAGALAEAGHLEEAAAEFRACVALAPDSEPARFNYGGVLRRLGRNDEAIEQLAAARALAPDDPDVCVELGLAYQAQGNDDKAIEAFERAIALNPDSPESRTHLPELIRKLRAPAR
jgi:polyferredoxin/Tfp pilus assembly protein PilF